jgi:hypothetical protein
MALHYRHVLQLGRPVSSRRHVFDTQTENPLPAKTHMPRYFFHLKCGTALIRDEDGLILRDVETLRTTVVRNLREVLGEADIELADSDAPRLEIANEAGQTVLVVPLEHAVLH